MAATSSAKLQGQIKSAELITFCCCLFAPLSIWLHSGYSIAPLLLLLLALLHIRQIFCWPAWRAGGTLGLGLGLFFVGYSFCVWLHADAIKTLDTPSRSLLILPVLALLLVYRIRFDRIMLSFALGAILAGCYAIHDVWIQGNPRAFASIMPIQSGNISMLMGLLSLYGSLFFYQKKQNKQALICTMGSIFGLLGSFLSLSRGGWLALIILPIYSLTVLRKAPTHLKKKLGGLACIIALICSSSVYQGWQKTLSDWRFYQAQEINASSVGLRVELWKSYWQSFREKPFLGWGLAGVRESQKIQWENGTLSDAVYAFDGHAHNEFLHTLATQGLVGFIFLLALFMGPAFYFFQQRKHHIYRASTGLICIGAVFIFCLTQNFLSHHSGMLFYVTSLVLWASSSDFR